MLNINPASIFRQEEEAMLPDGNVLAVWGSPSSGKTTVSVKLAHYLASRKKNVILLLCDMVSPPLPCLCNPSELVKEHSLGNILAATHVTQGIIKENCVFHKKYKYLTMIGMKKGENVFTYAPYTQVQAEELVRNLKMMADYVIIDCGSYIAYDILSAVSLIEADYVLRLVTCNLKSISYLSSQLPLLKDKKWDADKQIRIVSDVRPNEAANYMEQVFGKVAYTIPHSTEVETQALEGRLFCDLTQKESRDFKAGIDAIGKGGAWSMNQSVSGTHELFFSPEDTKDFQSVLKDVQEYISSKYSTLILDGGDDEVKQQIKRYISKYVMDYRILVKGMTEEELIDTIYTEMAEFSFLTKYIFGTGIEEINVNSWRDIEVQYSNGTCEKLKEHFESPEHAINVIRRMLHISGMVLDNASPAVLGHLSKNIRIAVLKTPLVDENVGVAVSIRIVNPMSLTKDDFVKGGTATEDELDFLSECLRYGISICVAGATSSGKTTVTGWLLGTIPDSKRIFTIENGSRELDLVRERDGAVCNSVIHTITRASENEKQNIDQDLLLDMALRFDPEIICVGEMRSYEAYTAQEATCTGHTVLTTIHSNSCESTYRRMCTLCKRKYDIKDETLMSLVTEAFPIIVFTKQLENKKRKIMEIMECEILPDGNYNFRTLFHYHIRENRMDGTKFVIKGSHEKVNGISEGLKRRLLENGMPKETLVKITGEEGKKC